MASHPRACADTQSVLKIPYDMKNETALFDGSVTLQLVSVRLAAAIASRQQAGQNKHVFSKSDGLSASFVCVSTAAFCV